MGFRVIFFSLLFATTIFSHAQNADVDMGARGYGIGGASVTIHDAYAMFNNIGGISFAEDPIVAFSYLHRYGVHGLDKMGAGALCPVKDLGVLSLSFLRFGGELYNQQRIGVGFGNKIGFVRLGMQANYLQVNAQGLGRAGAFILEFGGIVELIPELILGAYVYNISRGTLSTAEKTPVPVVMKAGISYRPLRTLMINAEIYYQTHVGNNVKIGVEYRVVDQIFLRAGFNTNPSRNYFGIGFAPGRFAFDYAFSTHFDLGFAHQASACIKLGKQ